MVKEKYKNLEDEEVRSTKVEEPYFFSDYQLTINASSLEEATKKLKAMKK